MDERNKGAKCGREGPSSRLESWAGSTDWGGDPSKVQWGRAAPGDRWNQERAIGGHVWWGFQGRGGDWLCPMVLRGQLDAYWEVIAAWMKNIACHVSKQSLPQPASHHITTARWWALGELRMEAGCLPFSSQLLQQPPVVDCEETYEKPRILAPDKRGIYQRNDFSGPRFFHLPIYRKALNSLPWNICFSLSNSNLLMGFPCSSVGNESACSTGAPDLIPGSKRSPGEVVITYSNILAWEVPRTEEPWGLQSTGSQE